MFTYFKTSIHTIPLPKRFTFPFNYVPHPLCIIAANELQHYLKTQTDWVHDFGINHYVDASNVGKMFGVLVVLNQQQELGYISAFSGRMAGTQNIPGFVPPILDLMVEEGFYRKSEAEIVEINKQIFAIENSQEYINCKMLFESESQKATSEIHEFKEQMKIAKIERDTKRNEATDLQSQDLEKLQIKLNNESIAMHYANKQLIQSWNSRLHICKVHLQEFVSKIETLKEERKNKSALLQKEMFAKYQFLNKLGEVKSLLDIFTSKESIIPPSGAGDCAAPKLLQYAYTHNLQPIAMAEFWWGQSPNSEIRKHGNFYPSCKSKCEPILGHMLHGLDVDPNPIIQILQNTNIVPILFEDESIIIVNKPEGMLSVPGKTEAESVYSYLCKTYPNVLSVHRLDMSTSGIMVFVKTKEAHEFIQKQFEARTVKKRYVAVLQGRIEKNEGIIDLPLRVDLDNRPNQLVCFEYGKPAITKWKVIERNSDTTRVYFYPYTGRTHQLRVHAAHSKGLNCAIVGDELYGIKADRLHLHAECIEFIHPISKKRIHFEVEAGF